MRFRGFVFCPYYPSARVNLGETKLIRLHYFPKRGGFTEGASGFRFYPGFLVAELSDRRIFKGGSGPKKPKECLVKAGVLSPMLQV